MPKLWDRSQNLTLDRRFMGEGRLRPTSTHSCAAGRQYPSAALAAASMSTTQSAIVSPTNSAASHAARQDRRLQALLQEQLVGPAAAVAPSAHVSVAPQHKK